MGEAAVFTPTTDSLRLTLGLSQCGHATAVAAVGTYFSNSRPQPPQWYS